MTLSKKGFTLIELLVVVLILGIMASIAIPGYRKSVETSRAGDSQGMLHTVATANRMYFMDKGSYYSPNNTQLTNSHPLVSNKYLAAVGWDQLAYNFFSCNQTSAGGCCQAPSGAVPGSIACAQRKSGFSSYSGWIYRINADGLCTNAGGAPPCAGM